MPDHTTPPARRSVRRAPRVAAATLATLVALLGVVAPGRAANDASDVVVEVVDASSGTSIGLARVLVQGETGLIGYTDAEGHARFESVATGSYRASVVKRGFVVARSPLFDVVANQTSTVRVRLQRTSALQQIGSVSVSRSPARASREVGQDDALRYLNGSLRDAIGDLPGVTSNGDGVQIDGNDASQTGTTVDGVPIAGAGSALGDRGINADLFGGASVSSGAANGALGGNVGFRTLQPTRFAQQQATLQYGSDNGSSALVLARGSVRNLGYVVEHAVRGRTSPLTGLGFTDQTGLSYRHDGDRVLSGDLAKLRWAPSIAQTLTLTASATETQSALACAQFVAHFPCGYGPNAFAHARGGLMMLSETATIGGTTLTAGGFVNASRDTTDEPQRRLAGTPAPQSDELRANARGFNLGLQLPGGERHEVSLAAQSYGLTLAGSSLTMLGTVPFGLRTAYHGATVADRYHLGQRLTLTARAGVNGSNGSSAFLSGLGLRWQPNRGVAYDLAAAAGDAGAGIAVSGTAFPDPRSLTFDCTHGIAFGNAPAVNAAHQRSSSVRGSVERSGRHGRLALTAWTARLSGAPVLATLDAAAIGLPASYAAAVGAFAASPYVCGSAPIASLAFTSFQPADQLSRGATLAGTLEIGKALIAGFATVQSRFVTAGTPATAALSPVGAQVPGTPLHRAGLVGTARLGRSVDALANLSYTAANNPNRLQAYTVVNAGFAAPLRYGSLALVGTNLGNVHAGPFVPAAETFALARAGGAPLLLPATPLPPRAVALTYTVRTGRLGSAGSGAGTAEAAPPDEGAGGGIELRIHAAPLREGAHPDALRIDPDNDACTPAAARIAQPVMDAMGRISAAAERAKTSGRFPATLPGGRVTVGASVVSYVPYEDGARYVVSAAAPMRENAALLNCARLGVAGADDREKFHVYVPAEASNEFFIAYAPSLGIYFVPPGQPQRGAAIVRASVDPIPSAPPAAPFALKAAPACPVSSKPVADAMVAAVRAARDAQRAGTAVPAAEIAQIVARGAPQRGWLEIAPGDQLAQAAVLQCLHVAGVPPAQLQAAGIADQRRPGTLGFSDRFGFYLIGRP